MRESGWALVQAMLLRLGTISEDDMVKARRLFSKLDMNGSGTLRAVDIEKLMIEGVETRGLSDKVSAFPQTLPLPFRCLSLTPSTAFPWPCSACSLPFLGLPLPFHCHSLTFHCLFIDIPLPFLDLPLPLAAGIQPARIKNVAEVRRVQQSVPGPAER